MPRTRTDRERQAEAAGGHLQARHGVCPRDFGRRRRSWLLCGLHDNGDARRAFFRAERPLLEGVETCVDGEDTVTSPPMDEPLTASPAPAIEIGEPRGSAVANGDDVRGGVTLSKPAAAKTSSSFFFTIGDPVRSGVRTAGAARCCGSSRSTLALASRSEMSLLSSSLGSALAFAPELLRATTLTTLPALSLALPTSHDVVEKPAAATVPKPETAAPAADPATEPIEPSVLPPLFCCELQLPKPLPLLPHPPMRPLSPPEPPNFARMRAAASSRRRVCRAT